MAKNITIREGDTAKQFTAKKLKMNLVGGGTANFVPEDEVLDYVNLKDHTFNQSGTFNPSQFNCDGFRQVKIDIPADVKEKTITANGEYNAGDDNVLGYSKVTVAVPGGGGGGPFTVRFFDDDRQTVIKTEAAVPYGGSASCTLLDGTLVGGLYFKGWNPSPTNVKENMNCYPMRGDYVIDHNEIQDSWETICADNGAHYPLNSYKPLVVTIDAYDFDFDFKVWNGSEWLDKKSQRINVGAISIALHMVKVAEGEDNSTSTWVSTGAVNFGTSLLDAGKWSGGFGIIDTDGVAYSADWGQSAIRRYLNTHFLEGLPLSLRDTIKQVNKSYLTFEPLPCVTSVYPSGVEKTSLDKVWMLSKKEVYTMINGYTNAWYYNGFEANGIDYTTTYIWGDQARSNIRSSSTYGTFQNRINCVNFYKYNSGGSVGVGNSDLNGLAIFGFCL